MRNVGRIVVTHTFYVCFNLSYNCDFFKSNIVYIYIDRYKTKKMTTTNLILVLLILLIFISFFVFLGKTQTERLINTLLNAFTKDKQTVLTKTDDVSKELSILNTKVYILLSKNTDAIIKQ